MIIFAEYSLEEIFSAVETSARYGFTDDGKRFKITSARINLFHNKGVDCVTCGITGVVFRLETHDATINPHLNLYAQDEEGEMVLMTKDHIMPKSKGGANELDNYQPMCTFCNSKKADKF